MLNLLHFGATLGGLLIAQLWPSVLITAQTIFSERRRKSYPRADVENTGKWKNQSNSPARSIPTRQKRQTTGGRHGEMVGNTEELEERWSESHDTIILILLSTCLTA